MSKSYFFFGDKKPNPPRRRVFMDRGMGSFNATPDMDQPTPKVDFLADDSVVHEGVKKGKEGLGRNSFVDTVAERTKSEPQKYRPLGEIP